MRINKILSGIQLKKKIALFGSLFLLLQTIVIAQDKKLEELKTQFEAYQINHLNEKVFIHTDKSFYLAGETVWFKAYVVDCFFNRPLALSKVLYIEIIDKNLKPILQTKVTLDSAMGNGSIAIPISITSGNYILRAYTQWMKNFSADYYYEQSIAIVNTVREMPLPADSPSKKIDFQFFPEGGNLVAGLTSKIAFKATGDFGNGINCNGSILNDKNDTITTFKSLIFGMGNFAFTPQKNEKYKAIIKAGNNEIISQSLPIIYNSGYVINLIEAADNQLIITINCTSDFANSFVYLFAHSHHLIKSIQTATPINGKVVFTINKKDLLDGISHFTIFNSEKKPICERLYFKQPTSKLLINANIEKLNYNARGNINLNIGITDQSNIPTSANLSMSVFLIDSLQPPTYANIESYLWLCSDLKGKIESPDYYFNDKNINVNTAVDNLMLTQGWRRFNWDDILQNKKQYFEFIPEYEGLVINAKIIDKASSLPIKNVVGYLSVPNKSFHFLNAISDTDGKMKFNLNRLYGNNEIITQTDNKKNNYQIDIDNPFSNAFSTKKVDAFKLSSNFKDDLLQRHIGMQVQHTYHIQENKKFIEAYKSDTTAFYGSPTFTFNLDAFTRFNTMEEVIKEFVTDVQLRTKGNESYFRVYDRGTQAFFDTDPLLLIDGVPIMDANKIVAFDPLKIQTIDVISNKYYLGALTYDGIISFRTYNGDLAGYQLDPNAVVLQYDGLQQQREFYNPKYETENQQQSRIPDFRNTLCWKPDLKTDYTGKTSVNFYTSDLVGKFAIVIQGITKTGKSGSSISTFEVKP